MKHIDSSAIDASLGFDRQRDDSTEDIGARVVSIHPGQKRFRVVLLVGLTLTFFSIASIFSKSPSYLTGLGDASAQLPMFIVLVALCLVMVLCMRLASGVVSKPSGMVALIVIAFFGTALAPFVLDSFLWPVAAVVCSAGMVALMFQWWSHSCALGHKSLMITIAWALFGAAVLLAIVGFVPMHEIVAQCLQGFVSAVACLLLFVVKNDLRKRLLTVTMDQSRDRIRNRSFSRLGQLNYFSLGLGVGAVAALWLSIAQANPNSAAPAPLGSVLVLAILGIVTYLLFRKDSFDVEKSIKEYLSMLLSAGFVIIPFVGSFSQTCILGYLMVVLLFQVALVFSAGAELVRFEESSPVFCFSEIAFMIAGIALGSLLVVLVWMQVQASAIAGACICAVVYTALVQVQINKVSFPQRWIDMESGNLADEIEVGEPASPGYSSDLKNRSEEAVIKVLLGSSADSIQHQSEELDVPQNVEVVPETEQENKAAAESISADTSNVLDEAKATVDVGGEEDLAVPDNADDLASADTAVSAETLEERLIPSGSYVRNRLDDIAEKYKLSPRQREILDLLARGRDTQYIMDYFVISRATAKTHVYNIYRKMDIHSRQDLYDLIECEELQ